MANESPDAKTQTLFNAGLAKLERIHQLKMICHDARLNMNWVQFEHALGSIRSELNERMSEVERKQGDDFEIEIHELMMDRARGARNTNFWIMFQYQRFLSDIEFKCGLSMPDKPASQADEV